jgi:DNA-binding LacI/PurR family transcriptional regulator
MVGQRAAALTLMSESSSTGGAVIAGAGNEKAVALAGCVPGDVSIVGYDDSRVAQLSFIDLTSVRQAADVAELAIQAASERLDDGRTTDRDIVLAPTLVVRGSTGPAPGTATPRTASRPGQADVSCS